MFTNHKRKFFFIEECQLINIKGMIALGHHSAIQIEALIQAIFLNG